MADGNYAINYEDERFKAVNDERDARLNQINETYNNMVNQSDQFYQDQINAARDYATTQQDLQNQQTQLAIDEINQQKDKLQKDYLKEQRGAYTDWQRESNRYGVNAEQQAASGLRNTGYSESSQVNMFNTYQNRVATARESYGLAVQNYDNGIREARLANNSKLAEIAYKALQTELELSLNGFQYKNNLLLDQINKQQAINDTYYNRWTNVLNQMNTENALAESIRQYNEKMAYQRERDRIADEQWQKEYDLAKKAKSSSGRRSSGGSSSGTYDNIYSDSNATTNSSSPVTSTGSSSSKSASKTINQAHGGAGQSTSTKATVAKVIKDTYNSAKSLISKIF